MTGLAGLSAATLPAVREVFVTDGNVDAVQNLRICVGVNVRREAFAETAVCARQLLWAEDAELGGTGAGSRDRGGSTTEARDSEEGGTGEGGCWFHPQACRTGAEGRDG